MPNDITFPESPPLECICDCGVHHCHAIPTCDTAGCGNDHAPEVECDDGSYVDEPGEEYRFEVAV